MDEEELARIAAWVESLPPAGAPLPPSKLRPLVTPGGSGGS